jgi:hypothetical protein
MQSRMGLAEYDCNVLQVQGAANNQTVSSESFLILLSQDGNKLILDPFYSSR